MTSILSYGLSPSSILKCKDYAGFAISETKYLPRESLNWHSHSNTAFIFVLDGSFEELGKRTSFNCGSMDVLIRSREQPHQNRFSHVGARCMNVELSAAWLENHRSPLTDFQGTRLLKQAELRYIAPKLFQEFLINDPFSNIAVEGLLLEMVAQSCRMTDSVSGEKAPPWLTIVRDMLHSHFRDNITIVNLAHSANVHPTHMIRAFRKHFACTIGDYLRRLRIDYACSQLLESQKPLAQIALDSGFADQSHFTVTFKRLVGVTPGRYRYVANSRLLQNKVLVPRNT